LKLAGAGYSSSFRWKKYEGIGVHNVQSELVQACVL